MIHLKPLKCRDILPNFTFEALALQVPGGHFLIFFLHRVMYISLEGTCSSVWTWPPLACPDAAQLQKMGQHWANGANLLQCYWTDIVTWHESLGFLAFYSLPNSQHLFPGAIWILRLSLRWSKSYGSPWWRLRGFDSEIPISICRTESSRGEFRTLIVKYFPLFLLKLYHTG